MLDTDIIIKDDVQLTVSMEERDQQSMYHLYDKYSPALYGLIYRKTNNTELAEDCLMATFTKAWNEIANFQRSGSSLFTWLLNIAWQCANEVVAQNKKTNPVDRNLVNGRAQESSAFEMVYIKGLSVSQAAEFKGITDIELRKNIRIDLQTMTDKMK